MIIYYEQKIGNQSVFIKRILDNYGNELSTRKVYIPLYQVKKDNFTYLILYDDHMNVIHDAYEYLNYDLNKNPITTRTKAAFSIRLLYCFMSLSGYDIKKIDELAFREFLLFLRGLDSNPDQYTLKTLRSANTVNGYLSEYRKFFKSRNINCDALFRSSATTFSIEDEYQSVERKKYDNNLKASTYSSDTVPKYIAPDDFRKLYRLAINEKDRSAQLIMHLMYGYGLRLGEVLGITMEDIKEVRDNVKFIPVIFLRNRMSDKKFQFAKNLPHILNKKQYSSKDYQDASVKIIITYSVYEELIEFIEKTHMAVMKQYPDNYDKGIADIVSVRNKPECNHYVFLNRYGRVLSDQTWSNSLKKYFEIAQIQIDYDIRENNLSHRFRHGFAMFHARFSEHPVDILSLQKMMRHKRISSTIIYFNPTHEEELKIKTEFQDELYNMIPELKGSIYGKDN